MKLKFGERLIEPQIWRLYDLRDLAFDSAWFEGAPDRDAHYLLQRAQNEESVESPRVHLQTFVRASKRRKIGNYVALATMSG